MSVVAKFVCSSSRKYQDTRWENNKPGIGFLYEYEFYPVQGASEENKKFFATTPSGSLKMNAVYEDLFIPGEEYYLEFSPAKLPVGETQG